jgi:hypothetical protein
MHGDRESGKYWQIDVNQMDEAQNASLHISVCIS